ncbi:MAG: biosynthetic-type acetolactate synthase large subunit [Chloroflexi bacterium]|nr:biosynthetic-type acetolactate synthase large subunit [Chloroflexota bacterium]
MERTGAEVVCEALCREGVDVLFGIPGGAALPLYDAFTQYPELRHILVRHEQAAAHAADGYARATGRVGVCVATSGPGATNLVTGLATAYMDSAPVVAITAQVATHAIGSDAFQEVDIVNVVRPITRAAFQVRSADDVAETLATAFRLARTGRPRPVLVDIPKDVFAAKTLVGGRRLSPLSVGEGPGVRVGGRRPGVDDQDRGPGTRDHGLVAERNGYHEHLARAVELICQAERPLIIAGRGIHIAGAWEELRRLAERCDLPVTTTLLGISAFPESHPLSLGMLGMHGFAWCNLAVSEADLILALGTRLDDRACSKFDAFAPKARIVHLDVDPAMVGRSVRVDVPLVGDARAVLAELLDLAPRQSRPAWRAEIDRLIADHPCTIPDGEPLRARHVVGALSEVTGGDAVIVTDVGQHQMWTAQHYRFDRPNSHITSGGLGTMGFAVPAAMGAKVGRPDATVWAVVGDGGFQMNSQELATLAQENLDLKIAVVNNGYLGMVRQWQELYYGRRYSASSLANPDFARLAEVYGVRGLSVRERRGVRPALEAAMAHRGPVVIDFLVEMEENVYPMVTPGRPLWEVVEERRPVGV